MTDFDHVDLTGARFGKVQLNGARFRMVDLSGAVLRDVVFSGAEIEGEVDGLRINGVEVAPLIEAERRRGDPVYGLLRSADPDELRTAWAGLQRAWTGTLRRVAAMPAGTADRSVQGEWSVAETLRHLVFATDAWLGANLGDPRPFHPWGLPFTDVGEFADPAELGLDLAYRPRYAEVLGMRAERVAKVTAFLDGATPERLAQEGPGPAWAPGPLPALRCLRVILIEEWEHRRFAERDLDVIAAGG